MNNSKEGFVLYKGKKYEVKNGELHLPDGTEIDWFEDEIGELGKLKFDEIEGFEKLTNLKKLYCKAFYLRKIENIDHLYKI